MNEALNREFIETQYRLWKTAPERLSEDWRHFFQGFELGWVQSAPALACDESALAWQAKVEELVHRYRDLGHLLACMDPLSACPVSHPLLEPRSFGIEDSDLDRPVRFTTGSFSGTTTLRELLQALKETYCRTIGVEYMHLQDPEEREWLQGRMEPNRNRTAFDSEARNHILQKLLEADEFERFLNKTYVGVTRFSIEGADTLIPGLDWLCTKAVQSGCCEMILGMAHRGRLNVLAHIFNKPYADIFVEFEHCYDPEQVSGYGDVKYHNGYLNDVTYGGRSLRLFMVPNPSHLEAVDPVVEGVTRARQDVLGSVGKVLPVLIHGDAAFAGQGIVAEVLNMSQLEGYRTGGTVHIVVNNQIGYTTLPADARSSRYATDVAKGIMAPIFHVHGEDPEAACHVIGLALDYRNRFQKDVVIDLVCYRRHGHNEGDDPYFTQPQMVERIRSRPTVAAVYEQALRAQGGVGEAEVGRQRQTIEKRLDADWQSVHGNACAFPEARFYEHVNPSADVLADGGGGAAVSEEKLIGWAKVLCAVPEGFVPPPKIVALLQKRLQAMDADTGIDWAFAETLAFASLLRAGISVRLSGQDVRRGTFSQRHCMLTDIHNERRIFPLQALTSPPADFQVFDSLLAEPSVLGFEYGYSLLRPECLTIWEAQFGDFVNNAQSIIDLFIASGETKWHQQSALVVLLPHGLEGLGPEHSSARPERLLQLCAGDNMQVCQPTTPAQFFHLLRRQAVMKSRKPLFVLTPKSLLRAPQAVSRREAFAGGTFEDVLVDRAEGKTEQVLFCSGKIAYDLMERRQKLGRDDVSIVRMERLYPFDAQAFTEKIESITTASRWLWVQEEPENMGAYRFLAPHIEVIINKKLRYVGRAASSSPATGYPRVFKMEQESIFEKALA